MTFGSVSLGGETQPEPVTFTYKQVGDLMIKADVHRPATDDVCPVIVWIHGGALINGHRAGFSSGSSGRVKNRLLGAGYVVVSIDYRLAPETQLPEIIEDLEDAMAWVGKDGPKLFGIDGRRIAVMGGSAGGYLTLAAGYRAKSIPQALVSFWGYGDLVGDWYSKPSLHPRHQGAKLTREEAYAQVSGPPISDSRDRKGSGGAFYKYCRQHGHWPKAVSGWDPHRAAKKFHPYMPVKNVTPSYPPTFLIHGTDDTDVPYEQSVMMAEQLSKYNVAHRLMTLAGAEHGFGDIDEAKFEAMLDSIIKFLDQHLQ